MPDRRTVDIFTAGCGVCEDAVELVNRIACESCEVTVLDMRDRAVMNRARELGIRSLPAVVVDGELAPCCTGSGVDEGALRDAGIGTPLA